MKNFPVYRKSNKDAKILLVSKPVEIKQFLKITYFHNN